MNQSLAFILISCTSFFVVSCSPTTDELYNTAYNLENEKKFKEAIEVYDKILKRNRQFQDAYLGKGYCYQQDSNYTKALYFFEYTKSLKMKGAFIFEENANSPFASEEAKHQVPIGRIHYQIAITKYYMDSLRSAYENFQTAIAHNYEIGNCYIWQGLIWMDHDSIQKGCDFFRKAMRVGETDASRFIKMYCR